MLLPMIRPEKIPFIFLIIAGGTMLIPGIALPIANQIFVNQIVLANRDYGLPLLTPR